ncbi:histone h2b [Moniliophthora roreri]|nr:histone h2b [Moniliophthora roreri]
MQAEGFVNQKIRVMQNATHIPTYEYRCKASTRLSALHGLRNSTKKAGGRREAYLGETDVFVTGQRSKDSPSQKLRVTGLPIQHFSNKDYIRRIPYHLVTCARA